MAYARFDVLNGHNTTERERVLHALVCALSGRSYIYTEKEEAALENNEVLSSPGLCEKGIAIGDMVIGMCGGIGEVIELGADLTVIKIAGTSRIENWSNESFSRFIGLQKWQMLPDEQYRFYSYVRSRTAVQPEEYEQRFDDVIINDNSATIIFRRRWQENKASVIVSDWKRWVRLKRPPSLVKILKDAGWGTESFLPVQLRPAPVDIPGKAR